MKNSKKIPHESLRVLVVEDNQDVACNIGDYLEDKGHIVDFAMDGVTGLHLAVTQPLDVIVLDIMLPGIDGFSICRRLRKETDKAVPVLMLTAKDTLKDKLEGFDSGTDDYMLKPFSLEELEARLFALARRAKPGTRRIIEAGKVKVDLDRRLVTRDGAHVKLNRTCYQILVELMKAAPGFVSRADLEHMLWSDYKPDSDVLRSHVYALRKALDHPEEESLIETVVGVGFRMRDQK